MDNFNLHCGDRDHHEPWILHDISDCKDLGERVPGRHVQQSRQWRQRMHGLPDGKVRRNHWTHRLHGLPDGKIRSSNGYATYEVMY